MLIFAVHYISSYKIGIGDRNSDLQDYFEDEHEGYFGSLDSDEEINKDRSMYIYMPHGYKVEIGLQDLPSEGEGPEAVPIHSMSF